MIEQTQFDHLNDELLLFNKQKEELTQKVKEFCQNKEHPIESRWKLFIESNLGEHENYYIDFETIELEYLRDFNKYEFVRCVDLIDMYKDHSSDQLYDELELTCNYGTDEYEYFIKIEVNPKVDIFKEEILQLFVKSFTYDW